jgi:hypothetical protein
VSNRRPEAPAQPRSTSPAGVRETVDQRERSRTKPLIWTRTADHVLARRPATSNTVDRTRESHAFIWSSNPFMSYSENTQVFLCRRTDRDTRQNRYLRDGIGRQAHRLRRTRLTPYSPNQDPTTDCYKVRLRSATRLSPAQSHAEELGICFIPTDSWKVAYSMEVLGFGSAAIPRRR